MYDSGIFSFCKRIKYMVVIKYQIKMNTSNRLSIIQTKTSSIDRRKCLGMYFPV